MGSTTTRLAIPYPAASDPNNVPSDMQALAARLDSILGLEGSGTLANRPAAGNEGFKYFAVDATGANGGTGVLYWDNGTAWVTVNPEMTVFGRTGTVTAATGDYTAAQVTNAADKSSASTQTFTGGLAAPSVSANQTGTAARIVGLTSGKPASTSGFQTGDVAHDPARANVWHFNGTAWIAQEPIGALKDFAGGTAPTGWLLCDGSAVSRATYADLFTAIGTAWGAGDGSTTFNVPDLRGKVGVGAGQGSGLTNRTLAASGGEENHTLSNSEMPVHGHGGATGTESAQHNHSFPSSNIANVGSGTQNLVIGGNGVAVNGVTGMTSANESGSHDHTISNDGGGTAHNNMQPFAVVNKIIKF